MFKNMRPMTIFASGVLFGTAGLKLLGCRDARKVYAHAVAAGGGLEGGHLLAHECGDCFARAYVGYRRRGTRNQRGSGGTSRRRRRR